MCLLDVHPYNNKVDVDKKQLSDYASSHLNY